MRYIMWKFLSTCSFITSAIMIWSGFNKMLVYDNGDYYPYEIHNAYVGGDAYNYIINGNYATGFFVLATLFVILGLGIIIIHYLITSNHRTNNTIQKDESKEATTIS